jgi:hypothetical protein
MDPRLNSFGKVNHRILALFCAWKKADPPPSRVKPLSMTVLRKAHHQALANLATSRLHAAGDCLLLAFFFFVQPGEYSGTPRTAVNDLFRVQDLGVWIGHRRLDPLTCPTSELLAVSFVTLTFTSQKNGVRGEALGHGRSGHPTFCPVAALTRRLLHLHAVGITLTTTINSMCMSAEAPWHFVCPADITALLRRAVALLPPAFSDFAAGDISARSTRAGGAMAMLCGGINSNCIRLIGRWGSDEMYRYLQVQC